ncbi:signal transduction histidine kinase/CheY-like chemotaxis protein/HPt (histidine-containing phosphotransfer) domain-containing protein/CHASE3 domain sensor protein [Flavobacterium sp. 2755]|uniref:ATP-binding response regulator n=1 Tax=Flavobacterium sp. 2755 TaxID=2817765 RepID=UPI0028627A87|nr:ATP-binding protein [Flavobacterium sp. 2755]MDR6762967.1 signal transduction histidine kinase/CheY-like chemotaxis protein/HPt (histidine-containing phosphotransfer) domain-containing protein/CHASE3 domain sensor protein [Flavobacterium sp. 2755]
MESKKSYTALKVLFSYVALLALVVTVGWFLYSENVVYNKLEDKIAQEKTKILRVSKLFSNVYKTESLARKTIQTNSETDFKSYLIETDSLKARIDTLKQIVTTEYQKVLLDSVNYLLSEKTENIRQLKTIKNKAEDEVSVNNAIDEITKMEFNLRKLELQDFTKNPNDLGSYQRNVLQKYVDYLNQNIPDDSTNTLSKKASDSILANSKKLLSNVKEKAEKKKETLNFEENKLLKNEIAISEQLRKVLRIIEREIIINSIKNNSLKEKSLKKVNEIVTASAIAGLILTLFFSVLIVSDYSKSQLYKKQLEIANFKTKNLLKSREQLISTVSHDLKTPLSTIVGYSELLGNSDVNTKQSYFIKNIKNSSEYITQLVQDLLDFSRIEAGKITIEKVPFYLPELIEDTARNIQTVYKEKNIDLIINVDDKLHTRVVGDPFRLKQILTNIIGNAYKFTEEGHIKISSYVSENENFFIITIEDTGIGIEKGNQKLVFEEFAQANENIEKKYGGTGLGLSICQKIISFMGGRISLESSFGKGSTFEIKIPLIFDQSEITVEEIKRNIARNTTKQTFVVIDDDINLLNLTSGVLRQEGHQVLSFSNAVKALEAIRNTNFDFVITDIQMPEMDGFMFLKSLRNSEKDIYKNQPVIALTGRTDLDAAVYDEAGFTTVVNKPYSPKILLETIQHILDHDTLPKAAINEVEETVSSQLYTLDTLKEFLGNDQNALNDVLKAFIISSNENLELLENAITEKNVPEINSIAHRIAPMFRQIEARDIGTLLKTLEQNNLEIADSRDIFEALKAKTNKLFVLLEQEIV